MPKQYYSLISSLPELSLNDKNLKFNLLSFRAFLVDEITPEHYELIQTLYYPFDILNFVNLVKKLNQPWDESGTLTKEEIEEGLKMPELLPMFFQIFINSQNKDWVELKKKDLINAVTTAYLDYTRNTNNSFIKQWVSFDQNLKNLLIWLNAKKFKRDASIEVLGNNYEAQYLRNTSPGDLNLKAWDNAYKEALTHFDNPNIAVREFLIDKMRWDYLNEIEQNYYFDVERLFAFAIKLQLIDRSNRSTEEAGSKKLNELLIGIKEGYALPEIFI